MDTFGYLMVKHFGRSKKSEGGTRRNEIKMQIHYTIRLKYWLSALAHLVTVITNRFLLLRNVNKTVYYAARVGSEKLQSSRFGQKKKARAKLTNLCPTSYIVLSLLLGQWKLVGLRYSRGFCIFFSLITLPTR